MCMQWTGDRWQVADNIIIQFFIYVIIMYYINYTVTLKFVQFSNTLVG